MKVPLSVFLLVLSLPAWSADFTLVNSPTAYLDRSGSFRLSGRVSSDLETSSISFCSAIWRIECEAGFSVEGKAFTPIFNAKILLLEEKGAIPSVAIGFMDETLYLAISKELNLPYLGFFSVHIGSDRDEPFGGVVKRLEIPSLNGRLRIAIEWYQDEMAFSLRLERYGAEIGGILKANEKLEGRSIVAEIGFSSEGIISRIEGAERLAGQAGKLATKALEKLNR